MPDYIFEYIVPSVFLIIGIVGYLSWAKYKKTTVFTTQNIALFSVFLAISIALSYWTITIIPHVLSFSFSTIAVMYIGYLLGPAEGMIFGLLADTVKSMLHGYSWMFLYAIGEPLIGFFAGIVGMYKEEYTKQKNQMYLIIVIQLFFAILFILSMTLVNVQDIFGANQYSGSLIYISDQARLGMNIAIPVIFLAMELMYWFFWYRQKEKGKSKEFIQFNISLLIVIITAIVTSFGLNSIAAQVYYGTPYQLAALSRVFSNPIFLPVQAVVLFGAINLTDYANKLMTNKEDRWK